MSRDISLCDGPKKNNKLTYLLTYLIDLHWSKRVGLNVRISLGELNFSVRYETYLHFDKRYVMLIFLVLYLVISYIMFVYSWANVSVTVVTFSSSSIAIA